MQLSNTVSDSAFGRCCKQSLVLINFRAPSGMIQNPILAWCYVNLSSKSLGTCMLTLHFRKLPCLAWMVVRIHTFQALEAQQQELKQ